MRKKKRVSIQVTRTFDGQKSEGRSVEAVYQIEGSEYPEEDRLVLSIGVGVIFDIVYDAGFTPILTFPHRGGRG